MEGVDLAYVFKVLTRRQRIRGRHLTHFVPFKRRIRAVTGRINVSSIVLRSGHPIIFVQSVYLRCTVSYLRVRTVSTIFRYRRRRQNITVLRPRVESVRPLDNRHLPRLISMLILTSGQRNKCQGTRSYGVSAPIGTIADQVRCTSILVSIHTTGADHAHFGARALLRYSGKSPPRNRPPFHISFVILRQLSGTS